jgi:NAD(P)-dependent dehydrogenase (short-subunit alcohol dehydrogenase family)
MRNIFVAGATGKQGRALIRALLGPTSSSDGGWRIYALTRRATSPAAQRLTETYPSNLTVVEGNLEDRESISKIFQDAKRDGGIWGVMCVLAFPGLGVDASGEEKQGKVRLLFSFILCLFFISRIKLRFAMIFGC